MTNTIEAIYNIKTTGSQVEFRQFATVEDIKKAAIEINEGIAILWLFSEIKTASITNGSWNWDNDKTDLFKYLVKARFFNDKKEWHIWRTSAGLQGRFREDGVQEGDIIEFIENELLLESTVAEPLVELGFIGNSLKLITKNYIGYQNSQAGYTDMRFAGFKNNS